MVARAAILGRLRRGLGRETDTAKAAYAEVERRLATPTANLIPQRGRPPAAERIERFIEMAEVAQCTLARIENAAALPAAVAEWLGGHNLAAALVMAADPALDRAPWAAAQPLLSIRRGAPMEADAVSLNRALAGIAETGTLMLASGPDAPTSLSFLPENHIVVVDATAIVGSYEEAFARLRAAHGAQDKMALPRAVNLITGPSRTGDIALKIELGAHGPRRLHIVIVERGFEADDGTAPT